VRERIKDWGAGLCAALGKRLVELTGDATPDARALLAADVIIATPEKWDGISRAWAQRGYVQRVRLLVIDEIHLLGADRRAPRPCGAPAAAGGLAAPPACARTPACAAWCQRAVRACGRRTAGRGWAA